MNIRKITLGVVAAATLASPLVAAQSADAAVRKPKPVTAYFFKPCVTKAEWLQLRPGMSRADVTRITGVTGRTAYSYTYADGWSVDSEVEYAQCMRNGHRASSSIDMSFQNYEFGDESVDWENVPTPTHLVNRSGWGTPYHF